MAKDKMPAPCEGAGDDSGASQPQDRLDLTPSWARHEISNRPFAIDYATDLALDYGETVHNFDCEDRGLDWASAIQERCANPMLLMRFLPHDTIAPVRHEAERRLRAWAA